jgi:hypothetical protein
MNEEMPERRLEAEREENTRLLAALEQAMLFIEEVAAGVSHSQIEAEALVTTLREAIEPS